MSDERAIRIFISSPSDVRPERLKAEQIVARLDREFAYRFHVEPVLWEREPLTAAHHPQEKIPVPHECEIVVVILWSRLGTMMPNDKFPGPLSQKDVTGTEWEFEDALAGARKRGLPDLLLYRKKTKPVAELDDRKALEERITQLDLVENFMGRWFRSADQRSVAAASHSFADTAEFEGQLYEHLHALLARRSGAAVLGVAIRWHDAPFRALLSYEYEYAPVFFGRTRARNELRELLGRQIGRGTAFVLVFGASGSGKSSLVKAGLLPDLALPGMVGRVGLMRRSVMRPSDTGGDLLAALAAAILSPTALPELAGLHYTAERLAKLLREAPSQAALPIEQGLSEAGKKADLAETAEARLALVVDQLEEIFTIDGLRQADREAFVAALDTLSKSGLVWVIATMRSDFFDQLETIPALAKLSAGEARFLLLPPDEAEIGQIIRQPAQEAGLRFEHDVTRGVSLDEVIRQAATKGRSALPLLSFLLDQLWQKRSETGELTFAAYQELSGLEGAIGRRAEEVFQAQPQAVRQELVFLLRALVAVRGITMTSRAAPLSLFPEGSPRRDLVDAFLDPEARLLVAHDRDDERPRAGPQAMLSPQPSAEPPGKAEARLRLAHEALLSHWPRARDQIDADARDLELRGRLEEEAEAWRQAPRRRKKGRVLASGLPLAEARALLARWSVGLPADIREFIAASRRAARRRLLRLAAIIIGAVAAFPLIAGIIWVGLVWRAVHQVEVEMAFVPIPAGCFEMGSVDGYPNEGPVHQVCIKPFDLAKYEVTQGEWRRVMIFPNNPSPSIYQGDDQLPIESVSWNEAKRFIWLMSFFGHGQYRLPSEAEYEYSERAGKTAPYYWASPLEDACAHENVADLSLKKQDPDVTVVNCDDHHAFTAPVGSFQPNPWGLYDIDGNVAAWVEDCYVENYDQAPSDGSAVTTGDCKNRAIRGSSWGSRPGYLRSAARNDASQDGRNYFFGFRVARAATPGLPYLSPK